jgi:hypothetical protein
MGRLAGEGRGVLNDDVAWRWGWGVLGAGRPFVGFCCLDTWVYFFEVVAREERGVGGGVVSLRGGDSIAKRLVRSLPICMVIIKLYWWLVD